MKRFFILFAVAMIGLTACNDNGKHPVPVATFEFELSLDKNVLSVIVTPSHEDYMYVSGILGAKEYEELGGTPESIVDVATEKIGQEYSGQITLVYEDLLWNNEYVVYAAQVSDGVLYGTPSVSENTLIYRDYVSFIPSKAIAAPVAVSDNGRYVIGGSTGVGTYIYDIALDTLIEYEDELMDFADVTDDGIVFGSYGVDNTMPGYFKDGKFEQIPFPTAESESGHIFSVTPDGKIAVGYVFENGYDMKPFIYNNGVSSLLEMGKDYNGDMVLNACARGIGANGLICGYVIGVENYDEECCLWTPELKYDLYSAEYFTWNDESGWFRYFYGSMFNFISPSGRYITSSIIDFGESGYGEDTYAYVYDTQEKKMYSIISEKVKDYRADAVSNNGLMFLSLVERGLGFSAIPYCYDINDNTFSDLETYLQNRHGYSIKGGMEGSVVSVSADNKIFVTGYMTDGFEYRTNIYILK